MKRLPQTQLAFGAMAERPPGGPARAIAAAALSESCLVPRPGAQHHA